MKSVMSNRFSINPRANVSRSSFNRSHAHKTTFDASWLVPIYADEALPGDTFSMNANLFARMGSPLTYPIMDNLFLETYWFECPIRQIWDNWVKMNGEQDNPDDSTDYLVPTITSTVGTHTEGSIYDYLGIPPNIDGLEHSALFNRAIVHIWNTWFRDQNLQDSIPLQRDDGPDDPNQYELLKRGKRHDYFTSSLPWPQKSDAGSVQIPLGDQAPIATDAATANNVSVHSTVSGSEKWLDSATPLLTVSASQAPDNNNQLYADLSDATAATINQLRQSIAVQRLFERDARGGTRYIEVIKNHWNVDSPDLRLQRPGLLGTGRSQINVNQVIQTNSLSDTVAPDNRPLGSQSAHVTVGASNHGFKRSFTEHSIIIGFANVRADLTYQQGLNRMWSRQTRFDHYWPELATIGEQEVLQKEIFASGIPAEDDTVFGYQERFAEYRYKPSMITGAFRSNAAATLDAWHLSQDFANAPVLSPEFIEENVPIDRVVAVPSQPHFIFDSFFSLNCVRAMPMYGIPGLDKL
ncbi:major capsid protein [Microviridae sp.]|nr:major capsid protein [Microviridae sp.]